MPAAATADAAELARFAPLAARWWDEDGPMAPLHRYNPVRLRYLLDHATRLGLTAPAPARLAGRRALDVGCGAGLACEPLARLGAEVVGIDLSAELLQAARAHASDAELHIDYRLDDVESLAARGVRFDLVTAFEVIEHVSDPERFVSACARLTRPGGLLLFSTLNRTSASYLKAVVAAEYLLGLLPRGTHDWHRFVKPSELQRLLRRSNCRVLDQRGVAVGLGNTPFHLSDNLSVNYLLAAQPRG